MVADNGSFGQRWTDLCRAFGLDVVERVAPWGTIATLSALVESARSDD